MSLWSRATCLPRDSNLCRSLLCPRGVSGPLGVPGMRAGAARPSRGRPGGDGGRWQEIPAAPPLPRPKRTRGRVFGERLRPRAAGGASAGHTGHCSSSAWGGNSDGPAVCRPPSAAEGADPGLSAGPGSLPKRIRSGIRQTPRLVAEPLVAAVGQPGWDSPGGTARLMGLSCSSQLERGTCPGTFSLSRAATDICQGPAVCPFPLPPAPCSSLAVIWKDI